MAYAKNKNPRYSQPRSARLSAHKTPEPDQAAKGTVLTVIVLAMLTVVLAVFFQSLADPERIAKQSVEKIASDYYENYLYETILSTNSISETALSETATSEAGSETADSADPSEMATPSASEKLAKIMSRYEKNGFAKVTLRQLLLYDSEKDPAATAILDTYCDENETSVRFIPDPPFGRKNYHIEYTYSCTF